MTLWLASTQLAIVALLAAFFLALARSIKLPEVWLWAVAWVADAAALAAFMATLFLLPQGALATRATVTFYVAAKTAFCLFLVAGARAHLRPEVDLPLRTAWLVPVVAFWSGCLGLFSPGTVLAQYGQRAMVAALMIAGAVWILRHPRYPRSPWLGWSFLGLGLFALFFLIVTAPAIWGGRLVTNHTPLFTLLNTAAELVVALACLVALQSSTSERLVHLNTELLASQERLRQLVDLDPLTNLINRRGLHQQSGHLRTRSAALIFLDLNGFKKINDRFGHLAGDRCLQRLAELLTSAFRSEDLIFRWGGDEFLIIAPGLDIPAAEERVVQLRRSILACAADVPMCSVSVGIGMLNQGGDLEAALKDADKRMYEDKEKQRADGSGPLPRLSGAWSG